MADGELAGADVIRLLKDFAASTLLRIACLSLSPGLLIFGRSLRTKALGFRSLMLLGSTLSFAAFMAMVVTGLVTSLSYAVILSFGLPSALLYATMGALRVTTPRRPIDTPVGWSACAYGAAVSGSPEFSVAAENDFLGMAVGLMARVNPLLTRAQAASIRDTLADDFEAMAGRPELERLPSMLPWKLGLGLANLDGLGFARSRDQAFVYVPPHAVGAKLPLVVVCHGHGGNPLVGCLPWEDLADDLGFVAAFPTFGYGNWEHPDAAAAILRCRKAVTERFAADGSRAVLAGISQGGCGVTRGATVATWAGLVYISPTLEPRRFDADFAELCRGPVLVAHGGRDINVKPRTVDAGVAALRLLGLDVTYVQNSDADHFYFFAHRADFAEQFKAWWPL